MSDRLNQSGAAQSFQETAASPASPTAVKRFLSDGATDSGSSLVQPSLVQPSLVQPSFVEPILREASPGGLSFASAGEGNGIRFDAATPAFTGEAGNIRLDAASDGSATADPP